MSKEATTPSSRFAPQLQAVGSAVTRNAVPSSDYVFKLAEAQGVLRQAAAQYAGIDGGPVRVSQASSLGAEDMVISHLINCLQLDIGIFVLETGALHQETLNLLARFKASSRAVVTVYQPVQASVVQFVGREGKDAMFKSITLRKACCGIRKMEPPERALAGKTRTPGSPACAVNSRAPAPMCRWWIRRSRAPNSTRWPTGPGAMSGTTSKRTRGLQPIARPVFPQHRLRALHPRRQPGRRLPRWPLVVGSRIWKAAPPRNVDCMLRTKATT
jgi:hypothetical protein